MWKLRKLLAASVSAAMILGLAASAAEGEILTSDVAAMSEVEEAASEIQMLPDASAAEILENTLGEFPGKEILPEDPDDETGNTGSAPAEETENGFQDEESDSVGEEEDTAPVVEGGLVIEEIALETDPMLESETEAESEGLLGGGLSRTFGTRAALGSSSEISANICSQNYSTYASPVNSYLTADGTGYLRIENFDDGILAEQYSSGLLFQSRRLIAKELELFGGFYNGKNAYYLVFGNNNSGESDSQEVVRVVKYDKNWNRLDSASLYGANTTIPFRAGSLRMTEYGGYLYIRTCHQMYMSSDGLNHQANLMIQVRTSDMTIMDSYSEVSNSSYGYVSHSFNQFILADDEGNLVGLDHGDAYPRSFLLSRYGKKAGSDTFQSKCSNVGLLTFKGEIGTNATGASIGGLEYSSSSYLTAGNSVPQDDSWMGGYGVRNIFVTSTSRSSFSASGSRIQWITSYTQDGGVTASTPQLIKCSSDQFLLLWDEMSTKTSPTSLYGVRYVFLDGNGNMISDIGWGAGCLSDCRPVVSGQSVIWYVTDRERMMFYRVNSDGTFQAEPAHLHEYEPEMAFEMDELECGLNEETVSNKLTTNSDGAVTYTSSDPGVAQVNSDGTVVLKGLGVCTITAHAAAGVDYRAKSLSYTLTVLDLQKQTIQVENSFVCTFGDVDFPLGAVCQDNAEMIYSTDNENVAKVSEDGIVTICGIGTAEILVRAMRTENYAGARASVAVTVNPRDVGECRAAFSRIGPLSRDDFYKYVIIANGNRIMEANTDYLGWPGSRTWSGSNLVWTYYTIAGQGNYTGKSSQYITPIRQTPVLTSLAADSRGAVLTWEKEAGALGYVIYRRQGAGNYQVIKQITDRETTSWTDTGVLTIQDEVSYCIKAYTMNASGALIYTGSSNRKFLNQTIEGCSISLSANSFVYNGKARTPSVTVTYEGKTLKQGRDYSVVYENNKNAGKASVLIRGRGDYTGSAKKTFTIKKAAQSLKVSLSVKKLVKGKKAKIKVMGSFGKVTYTSKNKKIAAVGSKGVIVGKAAGKTVITVKAAGDRNHKAASKKITVTVKKK